MALRITLRDGEKMILNGAVLRAVGRTQLCLENTAAILRGRDVMSPDEANTPAKRLYFACMMAYIDPDDLGRHRDNILILVQDLLGAFRSAEAKSICAAFAEKVATGQFYRALSDCRWLIAYEAEALARIPAMAE
ncbi:MAG TPA: flagellar biosynthesis repressor FlbT [Sphingomonadaceae bacterium]|nr:flagellar biosynthesis repressor FlbT [Sphingomonadaceae bacterium]